MKSKEKESQVETKKLLWKGNLALVEGALAGGIDAYFGYPITPQNEVPEYMSLRMPEEKRIFLQVESELAAINMVFGAALTGKKAMTTSSSPGISLMQEGISYLVGCELPAVIVNIQRGGPGLGNIDGAQGDYFQTVKGGGHGDYKMITLTPSSVQEMYEMTRESFSLAFKYRNPVIILADGVLGQMLEPAQIDTAHKAIPAEPEDYSWNLTGSLAREPRLIRSLLMEEGELEAHNYKLQKKFKEMEKEICWEEKETENADIILVGYGTSARINLDVYHRAREKGLKVGYLRLKTVFPFPYDKISTLSEKSKFLVVELSCGQMIEDVKLAVNGKSDVHFCGKPGGGLPAVDEILHLLKEMS